MSVTAPRDTPPTADPLEDYEVVPPDISGIEIDDGAPVDNPYSEKQMRLLCEPLYASWEGPPAREDEPGPRRFLAAANVGCFATTRDRPLVPDMMLSLDVRWRGELWPDKRHMTYFIWEFGKPPDVVIEVVSNRKGGELDRKKRAYARMRVLYYVVWDPLGELGAPALHAFELRGDLYIPMAEPWFEAVGLGLAFWDAEYEDMPDRWIRWCRKDGQLIPTGLERALAAGALADEANARADDANARADEANARADDAAARAARLEARLRELGLDPTE